MTNKNVTRSGRRRTFAEIFESSRGEAAARAFRRGITASRLRKTLQHRGRSRAAALLAFQKVSAVRRAIILAPESVLVTVDNDYQIGLLSVRFVGVGRVHLPPTTDLSATSSGPVRAHDPHSRRVA